ncbi:hypothetical protein ASD54_06600 [Rhizobium sp. Root149]|nr:hypothetical protein ASD54_06600 [Rhizobium sp. Root149]
MLDVGGGVALNLMVFASSKAILIKYANIGASIFSAMSPAFLRCLISLSVSSILPYADFEGSGEAQVSAKPAVLVA